jgi:toxin ParE1/3/4
MSKLYKTVLSRYAEDDLEEILDYYFSRNVEYARKLLDLFELRIEKLKELPERGRIVPELEKQNILEYRELIEGNYRIIYAIEDNRVIIHCIVDSRRNLEELLIKKLLRMYS